MFSLINNPIAINKLIQIEINILSLYSGSNMWYLKFSKVLLLSNFHLQSCPPSLDIFSQVYTRCLLCRAWYAFPTQQYRKSFWFHWRPSSCPMLVCTHEYSLSLSKGVQFALIPLFLNARQSILKITVTTTYFPVSTVRAFCDQHQSFYLTAAKLGHRLGHDIALPG